MKNYIYLFVFLLALSACNEPSSLVGSWKLSSRMMDPGDGSGEYEPVSSNKRLIFDQNGNVSLVNGDFCSIFSEGNTTSFGTYSTEHNVIYFNCPSNPTADHLAFEYNGTELTILPPCFEGCGERFVRE